MAGFLVYEGGKSTARRTQPDSDAASLQRQLEEIASTSDAKAPTAITPSPSVSASNEYGKSPIVLSSPPSALPSFLKRVSADSDFPALSAYVESVMSPPADDVSLQQLTNLILKDYGMTLKVLRTANSALYNRSGKTVISVSHAVALLGVDAVRHQISGLILVEHFEQRSPGMRELMVLALLSAAHAREAAILLRFPRKEEAYLCGLIRNLGELLVAAYAPRDYARVLASMQAENLSEGQACKKVLGFRYEAAGTAVVRQWKLPESVCSVLSASESPRADSWKRRRDGKIGEAEMLTGLTLFAHRLTQAVYRRESGAARASTRIVIEEFAPLLGLREEDVRLIVGRGLEETRETLGPLRVPLDDLRLRRQSESALATEKLAVEKRAAEQDGATDAEPDLPASMDADLLDRLRTEIHTRVETPGACNANEILSMVMEAILRGAGFERVLFALVDPGSGILAAKVALGEAPDAAREAFVFSTERGSGPVSAAVGRRQDVFSVAARDSRYDATELVRRMDPAMFGLYPVVVDNLVIGCLYFDRRGAGTPPDVALLARIGALRDDLASAIWRWRGADRPLNLP